MSLQQTLQVFELFDSASVTGADVVELFADYPAVDVKTWRVSGPKGFTDFIRITLPGRQGKIQGGSAATLGIIGRLGGIGARPARIGLVSDADGAIAAVSCALKLAKMQRQGDILPGDVIISTHICPHAPTRAHHPVDFMDSPVDDAIIHQHEAMPGVDAILSIDTTKGNRILNHKGCALSPTVKQGYILRVSEDLLRIMEMTTGRPAVTFPVTTQDITPYGNGVYHLNSIMQPATATDVPVVGLAICSESVVPGCGTGASHEIDIAVAVKFALEVAKEFGAGGCAFYNGEEYARLLSLYGSLGHLTTRKSM
ncbi:DUF1177 domain-containing protein [Erwinia tasmaniensis]|uniref:DUF1177 domain-containing protein n=1 Tax=Erwinia tasmaniensis (strain DSM 17950 / CFBP 7177 / CIP 109463 / NCPPB 4357 / Et1/99) TaxID=465817 RepID=B2VIS5_ERWT9|nr:DUF1177 domain-containing protein [Erwinia tasmaniensis]CAO97604.1 Conserved hypothetical protein [Erwinia tasmaniensis Et1/99]